MIDLAAARSCIVLLHFDSAQVNVSGDIKNTSFLLRGTHRNLIELLLAAMRRDQDFAIIVSEALFELNNPPII